MTSTKIELKDLDSQRKIDFDLPSQDCSWLLSTETLKHPDGVKNLAVNCPGSFTI